MLLGHMLSAGGVTLLGLSCVWGVVSRTQHWPHGPMATDVLLSLQNH